MEKISIIVPCYNEQEALPYFYEALKKVSDKMSDMQFEILFINDGSKDKTLQILKDFVKRDERVRYLSFSKNFGKEAAMYAGLENSTGDYVAIMDADMQDPPELLPEMLDIIKNEDYDSVATRRVTRDGEPPIRSFFANCYYKIMNKIVKADVVDGARDFRLMKRIMVDAIVSMKEYNRFSKGIFGWIGFNTKWLPYKNVERVAGETKWSFWKLFLYSIEGIVAFTTMPLAIAAFLGTIISLIGFVFITIIIVRTLIWGNAVGGWPSMMCVILMLGGMQLLSIGILGQYMGKTYLESKKRPIYIIAEDSKNKR